MTVRVIPVQIEPETSREVTARRFRFELHTFEQKQRMDMVYSEALGLSHDELLSADPSLMSPHSYPISSLKEIRLAQWEMDTPPGRIDLLSAETDYFLAALKACLVYGDDEAAADAEIARIVSNTPPS